MRRVTYGAANSLDNYIARKDHAVDWLLWGKEAGEYLSGFWKTIDAVLVGRKTYEAAARGGAGGAYPGVSTYLFSRTMKRSPHKKVRLVSEDAAGFVRDLKRQEGKGICVLGGGELANSLFEADLIDEVGVNIHPVLLGSGVPLFHEMSRQINLELIECRPFENGCVLVTYRVKR